MQSDNAFNAFLVNVSDVVQGLNDPGAIAQAACRMLVEHLGVTEACWTEVEGAPNEQRLAEAFHEHAGRSTDAERHAFAKCEPVHAAARAGQSLAFDDVRNDPRLAPVKAAFLAREIIGAAIVPVTAGGALRAMLTVAEAKPRRWQAQELSLLGAVAAQTWSELERARAVSALERELRDARELQRISSSLIEHDSSALYSQLLDASRLLMRSDFASLQMRVEDNDLVLLAHQGFHPESARFWDRVLLDGKSSCAFAMKQGEAVIVPDVEAHPDIAGSDDLLEFRRSGIRAIQSTPLISRDGRIVGMISTHWRQVHTPSERGLRLLSVVARQAADLIERRLADEALHASEKQYRALFESIDEGVARIELIFDAAGAPVDFRWLDHNPAFSRHTGLSEVQGKRGRAVFPDLDLEGLEIYARVAQNGQGERFERYARHVDRWFSIFASPVAGKPSEVVVLLANVTERKRAEEALRRSETHNAYLVRLGDALRPLGDPDAVKGAALKVIAEQLEADGAFYGQFDGDDLVVEEVYERAAPLLRAGRYANTPRPRWVREAFRAGQTVIFDDTGNDARLEPGNRERNVALGVIASVSVPMLKDGRLAFTLTVHMRRPRHWTATEIALIAETAERTWEAVERARTAAALRENEQVARSLLSEATAAHAEAEAANRAKDEFLATLSHELRTPLSAILLWARSLSAGNVKPAEMAQAVEAIVQSAESQSRLIEDLLDLSGLTAGRIELLPSSVDVARLIERTVDIVRPMAAAKRIHVSTSIEAAMVHAWLDERRIKQVLWNLLSNAVKFTNEGGHVEVRARADSGFLLLEVKDDGDGIDPAFLPHVFEKFRQADMAHTRRHSGLGIGLTIAQRLTELHDGVLEAASEGLGRGATFRLKLPWLVGEEPSSPSRATPPPPALGGLRILLIEDDAETRLAMTSVLERAGGQVLAFADGREVLTTIDAGVEVDVIVSDIGLPQLSGLELISAIGERYSTRGQRIPPACAVSAHVRDVDRRAAIHAGFDLYLAKPVTPERLIEAVADLGDIVRAADLSGA